MRPLNIVLLGALIANSASAKLNVVTTTSDLGSIAIEVGGNLVSVSSLIVGARDPHRLEAKPSYMSRASSANLWLAIGLELEVGYEPLILEGSRNGKIQIGAQGHVYAASWVPVLDVPRGRVSRADGDVHPNGNPHIWLDPYNGRLIALKLADKLGSLDRANAATYEANAAAFVKRLDVAMFGQAAVAKFGGSQLWAWDTAGTLTKNAGSQLGGWAAKMAPFRGKPIVTYHRSWVYFANRFDLKVVEELEPKPGIDPTPGHVSSVIRQVLQLGVKAILQEPYYSTRNGSFVAQRSGATLVVAPGSVGHDPAARDYISLFDCIVSKLSGAMGR